MALFRRHLDLYEATERSKRDSVVVLPEPNTTGVYIRTLYPDNTPIFQIRAFRVAKANNQWTEQDGEPYITQDQLNDLVAEILKEQGIHVVNGKIQEP